MRDNKILKAGIGYTVGNYLLRGLSFLTIPLFARLMSTADYGIYSTYIAYEGVLFVFLGLALHTSFKSAKYKFANEYNSYISNCVLVSLASLIIWVLVALLLYPYYADFVGFARLWIIVLVFHSFGSAIIQYYNSYIGLQYEYKSFFKIAFANAICNVVLSIVLILIFSNHTTEARITGSSLPTIIIACGIICYFLKLSKPSASLSHTKYALSYSLPVVPHGISQVVLEQFDRIMITSMVGAYENGIYSFAYNLYTIVKITAYSLNNVWEPWIFERLNDKDYDKIKKKSSQYALVLLLFSIIVVLISPELILVLGSKKYTESAFCVTPIIVAGYFCFLYTIPVQVEYYYEKTQFIAFGTVIAALVNICLNYVFISMYGYIAAAYTTLFTYILYFLFHYVLAWRVCGRCLFDTKKIFIYSVIILIVIFIEMSCIELFWVRWSIAFVLLCYSLIWTNKNVIKFTEVIRKIKTR